MSDRLTAPVEPSEARAEPPAAAAAPEPPLQTAPAAAFGSPLAAAREALGLSQADVASRLRLHPRQIAAIEAEQLESLPAGTFLRGFIRNFAKEVQVDPGPLLAALDVRFGPLPDLRAIGGGTSSVLRNARRERLSRQVVVLGSVAALMALAAIGWFASQRAAAPLVVYAAVPAPASPSASAAPAVVASGPPPGGPVSAQPAPEAAATAAFPPAAAPATAPLLRISIGEQPSWIEVLQGNEGQVIHSGLTEARSEHRLLAAPPLRLIVGNAASVRLEYRGQVVDLAPYTRSGVARLTIE
jgi:cytoskeleton protein RodZ